MNEQAKEVLAQLMQRALDGVDAAVEFSQQQTPDVVQQLLTWHFVQALILFLVGVLILSACAFVVFKLFPTESKKQQARAEALEAYKNGAEWTRYRGSSTMTSIAYDNVMRHGVRADPFCVLFQTALACIPGLLLVGFNLGWLKIWIAPKLYLLEYGASLVK